MCNTILLDLGLFLGMALWSALGKTVWITVAVKAEGPLDVTGE